MNKYTENLPLKKGLRDDGFWALERATSRLNDPAEAPALFKAMVEYGDQFTAYFLGTEAIDLELDALMETYEPSIILAENDKQKAFESTVYFAGLQDGARAAKDQQAGTDRVVPLDLDSYLLRSRIRSEYVFVSLFSTCYVFDGRLIQSKLKR